MYKLLIVEDEHLIRKWLHYTLDYQALNLVVVGEAKDGIEGVELIRSKRPDIVLTDINMPAMNAFEMFEATSDQAYAKIILSGYSDFANAKQAIKYGVVDFISKPIAKEELFACLQTVVAQLIQNRQASLQGIGLHLALTKGQLPRPVLDMLEWIQTHYQTKFTVTDMARDLGYSESYLYKMMKDHFEITINDYLNQYRIKMAIQKLSANPTIMVYQLAEEVGFSDYKYFNRVFKKMVGLTVTEFKDREAK